MRIQSSLRPFAIAGTLLVGVSCRDFTDVPTRISAVPAVPNTDVTVPASLPNRCGYQLTGVAFDGTYYYVAEGQFGGNCLIRYTADGQYVDQTTVNLDMRGLHWSPALGKLTTRHYNGGIVAIDYPSGAYTVLANYRTGPDQYAPAVDTDGLSYWIINGANAERHRLSDDALLSTIAVAQSNPFVIGVSNRWIYTVQGTSVNVYSKASGTQVGVQTLPGGLGCQGWGFGASSSGDRLLYVANCASATGTATGMGGKGLTASCGRQLTGVAWDGANYFVAEGQFSLYNCISRFTADSQFIDQIVVPIDMRGLHWVPALNKLTTRHYNGGIFAVDYAAGTQTVIANYRTGPDQYQPAVDPDGASYWILNGNNAERHRLSDDALLNSFAITTDNLFVVAVSSGALFTHDASSVHAYDKTTGTEIAALPVTLGLGCQGWGFGASASADRLLYVSTCGDASARLISLPLPIAPPAGLLDWWPGDGNAFDIVGARHGTLENGATFAPGKVANAFSLDGVGAYVTVPNLDRNQFTVDAWIKRDRISIPGGFDRLLMSVNNGGWGFYIEGDNTLRLTLTGITNVSSVGTIADLNWHHVAVTYNGSTACFYIDGQQDVCQGFGASFNSGGGAYTIGSRGAAEYFDGLIDELDLFDHALSAGEVGAIYAAGTAGKIHPVFTGPYNITVNPGAYSGTWQVLGGVIGSGTGTRSFMASAGDYTMHVGSVAEFVFHVLSNGTVTVDNTVAATGGTAALTFSTVSTSIDAAGYPLGWSLSGYGGYVTGSQTRALVPGLTHSIDLGAALGSSTVQFVIAGNGAVTSLNPSSATGGSGSLTFVTAPIAVDASGFGGSWRFVQEGNGYTGTRTLTLVRGVRYGIDFGLSLPASTLYFDVDGASSVTSANAVAATGGSALLTLNTSTIHVVPAPPSASWGISAVTAATGISDVVLVRGLSYGLTSPAAPSVVSQFALGHPCNLTPAQHTLGAVSFTLGCGPFIPPNVAPVVGTVSVPAAPQLIGTSIGASVTFTDANPGDTHTAVIAWGDGSTSPASISESAGSGTASGTHSYSAPGTYIVRMTVADNALASGLATPSNVSIFAMTPTSVWLGTKSSNDAGIIADLRVEIERNGTVISTGQLNDVTPGGNGFGKALLKTINATLNTSPLYPAGTGLRIRVLARVAASSPKSKATLRLWYDSPAANSRSSTFINGASQTYFLRSAFGLATVTGLGPSLSADLTVDRAVNGNAFASFGMWSLSF